MRIETEEKLHEFDTRYKPKLVELFGRLPEWAFNIAVIDLRACWIHTPETKRREMLNALETVAAIWAQR
jgi:hypothetical protein